MMKSCVSLLIWQLPPFNGKQSICYYLVKRAIHLKIEKLCVIFLATTTLHCFCWYTDAHIRTKWRTENVGRFLHVLIIIYIRGGGGGGGGDAAPKSASHFFLLKFYSNSLYMCVLSMFWAQNTGQCTAGGGMRDESSMRVKFSRHYIHIWENVGKCCILMC